MASPKKTNDYIRRTKETVLRMEVSHAKKKIPVMGIRNLSLFCETVLLDYSKVERAIQGARAKGDNTVTFEDWTISWMTIDQVREYLAKYFQIGERIWRITGKIPANINDFVKADQPFAALLYKFMER